MDQIFDRLKEDGHRLTVSRKLILEVLSLRCSMTVDDLHQAISAKNKKPNLSTVYRNLLVLKQKGLVTSRVTTQGETTYGIVNKRNHHHHLTCIGCHKSIAIRLSNEKLIDHQFKKYKFQPVQHILELEGYCQKCNTSQK